MEYDKELIAHKLQRWDKFITDYHLPDWETIPDFTSSTINNYVRLKIMPAPEKRKYHRIHIAYLIMILTMKQSLSISDVQKILPADSNETDVRAVYEDYSLKFRRVGLFFNQQVQSGSEGIRSANEQNGNNAVELLVIESALIAGFSKILAEKLIRLCGADAEDVLAAEQTPPQP